MSIKAGDRIKVTAKYLNHLYGKIGVVKSIATHMTANNITAKFRKIGEVILYFDEFEKVQE